MPFLFVLFFCLYFLQRKEERHMAEEKLFPAVMKKEMMVLKRRVPMAQPYIKGEEARKLSGFRNQQIYFYKFFETRFMVNRGEVYLASFPLEFGSEIHGEHLVAAVLDSKPLNPLVLVVPLKSEKEKELNPASDIRLGRIQGVNNGRKTIAIINQVRAIDKRRLFKVESIDALHSLNSKNLIGEYQLICGQRSNVYRLTNEQYRLIHGKLIGYVSTSYLNHDDELLVDF